MRAAILLDTHAFVWAINDDKKLGRVAREVIGRDLSAVAVSVMSFWEIALLAGKERFSLAMPINGILAMCRAQGMIIVSIDAETALDAGALPGEIHRDPADRMLVATARSLDCPLLTADRAILAYANDGYVKAIDASR